MFGSLRPQLSVGTKITEGDKGARVVFAEAFARINNTAKLILPLLNGKNTIDEISCHICELYPHAPSETVTDAVHEFIVNLWKRGVFLEHDIDFDMCLHAKKCKRFMLIPNFCTLPQLPVQYVSPILKSDYYEHPQRILDSFAIRATIVMKLSDADEPISLAALLQTACPYTFTLLGGYGKTLNADDFRELKTVILKDENFGRRDSIKNILCLHRYYRAKDGAVLQKGSSEKVICSLKNEFANEDSLVITEVFI